MPFLYSKVWVKALRSSSVIQCTITSKEENQLVTQFEVHAGYSKSHVISTPPRTYIVKLTSSQPNKIKGQFNIKIVPRTSDFYEDDES